MTDEERQDFLIAAEKLLDRLKDKEALQYFVDVVAQAAEYMLEVLDELKDEELEEKAIATLLSLRRCSRSGGSSLKSSCTGKSNLVGGSKPEASKQPRSTAS